MMMNKKYSNHNLYEIKMTSVIPENVKTINRIQYKLKDDFFRVLFNTMEKDLEKSPLEIRLVKPYVNEICKMLCKLTNNHNILKNKICDDLYNINISQENEKEPHGDIRCETKKKEIMKMCMEKMIFWVEVLQPQSYSDVTQNLRTRLNKSEGSIVPFFKYFIKVFYYHVIDVLHTSQNTKMSRPEQISESSKN